MFSVTRRARYLSYGLGLMLLCGGSASAQASLSLTAALAEARLNSLGGVQSVAHIEVMQQRLTQAGALPDPQLSLTLANLPDMHLGLDRDPMSQLQIAYSQRLPFPGKRALQRQEASHQVLAANEQSQAYQLWLAQQVAYLWWERVYVDQTLRLNQEEQGLYQRLIDTSQTLYSVGRGQQQDVLLAQLQASHLKEQQLGLRVQARILAAQLNVLMNRAVDTALDLALIQAQPLPPAPSLDSVQAMASQHAALKSMEADVASMRSSRDLAEKDRYPDFNVTAVYGLRDGRDDLTTLQVAVNLPIFAGQKQARLIDERGAQLMRGRYQLQLARLEQAAKVTTAHAQYVTARQQVALFEDEILVQARQSLDTLLARYQVNKVDFQALTQAQDVLNQHQTHYWRAYTQAWQAWARLHAAAGTSIEEADHE